MTPLLVLRRARRDLGILLAWMLLVAFAVVLAIAGPRLQLGTVDSGARHAVEEAGDSTDVLVGASVGGASDSDGAPVAADRILGLAEAVPGRLPSGLRAVYADSALAVVGPPTELTSVNGALEQSRSVEVQLDMLTPQNEKALALERGSLPDASAKGGEVDVVLSAAAASASGLTVGSVARVATVPGPTAASATDAITLRVVGIVRNTVAASSRSTPWQDMPHVWTPTVPKAADDTDPVQIAVLADPDGIAVASTLYANPSKASLRIRLDPQAFTNSLEEQVGAELVALAANDDRLGGSSGEQLSVSSQYGTALSDFPAQARAATAQISIMAAGVLGVAAAVILLVSRMLVMRRSAEIALERARGASLVSIGLRSLLETAISCAVAVALALVVAGLAIPPPFVQPVLVLLVILVALAAVPVQAVVQARGAWAGRRTPANLQDRVELRRRSRARRIAAELTLLALAAAAFVSLATRGLLETQTNGVDPLLASAPLLLAVAVTIVVLRIYRWPLLLAVALGRRSTGALGLLAAVRAQRSIAVLPLVALSLSVALAVGGGLLASTVASGTVTASWQRTGADVRVDAPVSAAQVAHIAATPGVTGATGISVRDTVQLRLGTATDFATVVAVDSRFPRFVAQLPTGGTDGAGTRALDKLLAGTSPKAPLPVVVDADVANELSTHDIGMYLGLKFVSLHVVGVVGDIQGGYLGAPLIYVDRTQLAARLSHAVPAKTLLVNGPAALHAVQGMPAAAIHTRAGWLSRQQHLALVSGTNAAISLATASIALLAVIALIVTVLGGARERGRSLSLVRTLGFPARLGWWLALAEIAPVLLAALVGGVVSGVGMVLLLEPVMGLRLLAGGPTDPPPTISAAVIFGLAGMAIVLLCCAALIEMAVRRRDRLSEVLRVGETV